MIKRLPIVLLLACAAWARAEDSFTKGLSAADFQAAGLSKLSPEELARLDALIAGNQAGAVAKATEETKKAVTETVRKEERAAAKKESATAALIDKFKVVLKPGTEIDYTTLDATLPAGYSGWEKGQVFTLTNGQQWAAVEEGGDYETPTGKPVAVRIVPGSMGSFFMEIEHGGRVRVKFRGTINVPQEPAKSP